MGPRQQLMEQLSGYYWSRSLHIAAKLGIVDLLRSGTDTAAGLAEATGIDPWRMQRFLRILIALGILKRNGDVYSVTERGGYLARDHPESIAPYARLQAYLFPAFTMLEEVLRTGQPGYEMATGRKQFDAMADAPDFAEAFDLSMNLLYVPETAAMVERLDFGRFSELMDVGGGNGEVLLRVLERYPDLRGYLFDLPHVVDRASDFIAANPAAPRCTVIPGSFFEPLPRGAEAILLRHIIHDWPEEEALVILKHCRDALPPGGCLLIAEALVEDADRPTIPIRTDLAMMTLYGGAERTLDEYRALLAKVGLRVDAVTEITASLSVIEARPA